MTTADLVDLVTSGGPSALLAGVVVLIMTGHLRLSREVNDWRADRDARLADAKEQTEVWRQAHAKEQAARSETERALAESLESARVTTRLLESLQRGQRDAG